jgi:hypothetical protein
MDLIIGLYFSNSPGSPCDTEGSSFLPAMRMTYVLPPTTFVSNAKLGTQFMLSIHSDTAIVIFLMLKVVLYLVCTNRER